MRKHQGGRDMPPGTMSQAVEVRRIVARFRARAVREGEPADGFWMTLANEIERKLLKKMRWSR